MPDKFPSLKAKRLLAILCRAPLNYQIERQTGSHRHLVADGRQSLSFSYHDSKTVNGSQVRRILVTTGLSVEEARNLCQ